MLIATTLPVACRDVINQAAKKTIKVRGPARMPTKVLRITTRKTPCGEGSKTWDRYEMRIHKRVIEFTCSMSAMREIVHSGPVCDFATNPPAQLRV